MGPSSRCLLSGLVALAGVLSHARGGELFGSDEGPTVSSFDVWQLASCWKVQ
jgi:hypothetical protein